MPARIAYIPGGDDLAVLPGNLLRHGFQRVPEAQTWQPDFGWWAVGGSEFAGPGFQRCGRWWTRGGETLLCRGHIKPCADPHHRAAAKECGPKQQQADPEA